MQEVSKALGYPGTPPNNTMTTNARAWFADPSNHTTEEVYQYDSVLVSAYNWACRDIRREKGDPLAYVNIGWFFENGLAVKQDHNGLWIGIKREL